MSSPLDAMLEQYVEETMRFSKALNLTSVKEKKQFAMRFVKPSLALCRWLPEEGRLLDVGSGMGIPAIPILLAKPGLQGVLVERRRKRAEFLRHLKRLFKLDATVCDTDLRELLPLRADICVARAVSHPAQLLTMCARHMSENGFALLPVARSLSPVSVPGWRFASEYAVRAGGECQHIHQYQYEEVSRET
jgi:16S rRNA (guanine(527)-N(7))-methyltransferase RsmG